jgi:hypothetical protein
MTKTTAITDPTFTPRFKRRPGGATMFDSKFPIRSST